MVVHSFTFVSHHCPGLWEINETSQKAHITHRVILIEPHTHYNYLFDFPRFASVSLDEHKVFIPWRGLVSDEKLPGSPSVLRGHVIYVKPDRVVVEKTYAEGRRTGGERDDRGDVRISRVGNGDETGSARE